MSVTTGRTSPRQEELLEAAYRYVLVNGLSDMSLRPLAAAIGSSPRVLLYLFGSKDDLVRALLARARSDEVTLLREIADGDGQMASVVRTTWRWLSAPEHRSVLCLWVEAYGRSLTEPDGPWGGFAAQTVQDWLQLLSEFQEPKNRRSPVGAAQRTLILAVLRGALMDLLATGDVKRNTVAVESLLASV